MRSTELRFSMARAYTVYKTSRPWVLKEGRKGDSKNKNYTTVYWQGKARCTVADTNKKIGGDSKLVTHLPQRDAGPILLLGPLVSLAPGHK